jgi:hypothetical protein
MQDLLPLAHSVSLYQTMRTTVTLDDEAYETAVTLAKS